MPKFFVAISFLSVLMGCASTSRQDTQLEKRLTPPLSSFLNKWKKVSVTELEQLSVGSKEDNIRWWKTYTLAMKYKIDPLTQTRACESFKGLAQEMEFPLHEVALLRAYESCPQKEVLPEIPATAPWYRDLVADIKLKEALETETPQDDITAFIEKARLENNKKNKEEFYKKALAEAEKNHLQEEISRIQELLYKNSPRLHPNPAFTDLTFVAGDYRFHRQFEAALETYKKILQSKQASIEDQFQALKNVRQTYKVAQRRDEYIHATADLVNWAKKQFQKNKKDKKAVARYHDAQVLFARTLWTEDQTSRAVKVLNETHRLLRGLYPMDEVYFTLGRIEEEKGNFTKALEYFEASYKQPISYVGLRDKISWLKSWNYYKLQKWEEAKTSL
ncbi:MAG: lytic murein transglycosylase, partial [Bdellovibrio sp.]